MGLKTTKATAALKSEPKEEQAGWGHACFTDDQVYFAYVTQLALNSAALFLTYAVIMM